MPVKIAFLTIVYLPLKLVFLPPEAFQGCDHILLEVGNGIVSLVGHLEGISYSVENGQRLTIGAPFLIGVTLPRHLQEALAGHSH